MIIVTRRVKFAFVCEMLHLMHNDVFLSGVSKSYIRHI